MSHVLKFCCGAVIEPPGATRPVIAVLPGDDWKGFWNVLVVLKGDAE